MTELMHKEFIIEDYREAQELMERDSHFLTLAGEAFGCTVSGRGNLVRVTGDEQGIEAFMTVVDEMRQMGRYIKWWKHFALAAWQNSMKWKMTWST